MKILYYTKYFVSRLIWQSMGAARLVFTMSISAPK
jgi:hypothetical protein